MVPLRFAVIGIGGYAVSHMASIAWLADQDLGRLSAVVVRPAEQAMHPERMQSLVANGAAVFDSIEALVARGRRAADILTVPIGIHQHVPVSAAAMRAGLDVYCEKPVAATIQEVDQLIAAEASTGRSIVIGFQHIYSHSMQRLKALIGSGRMGRVRSISLVCGWPRSVQYYDRNEWAGRLRSNDAWILDSPANSAHAHFLLNALYLAAVDDRAAEPVWVQAELYRAAEIASADTTQLRLETGDGVRVDALLSHCNAEVIGPLMHIDCEHGSVDWSGDEGETSVSFTSGETERFDNRRHEHWRYEGFRDLAQAIQASRKPICTPEFCRSHTLTVNAMHESCPDIVTIPQRHIHETQDWEMYPPDTRGDFRRVHHMDDHIKDSYRSAKWLSELGIPWARAESGRFETKAYGGFPQAKGLMRA